MRERENVREGAKELGEDAVADAVAILVKDGHVAGPKALLLGLKAVEKE